MPLSFKQRIAKAIVFFVFSLVILSLIRVVFFATYKTPEITFAEFLPAAWMGVRVDAKWLATLAVPAWLLLCLSAWRYVFWRLAVWMAGLATAIAVTVAVVCIFLEKLLNIGLQVARHGILRHDGDGIIGFRFGCDRIYEIADDGYGERDEQDVHLVIIPPVFAFIRRGLRLDFVFMNGVFRIVQQIPLSCHVISSSLL